MRVSHTLIGFLLLAGLTGSCGAPDQQTVVILGNMVPDLDVGCTVDAPDRGTNTTYLSSGHLDLSQKTSYTVFPLVENRLTNTEKLADDQNATIDVRGNANDFVSSFARITYDITAGSLTAGEIMPQTVDVSGVVAAGNGRYPLIFSAIPDALCPALVSMSTNQVELRANITVYGYTLGKKPVKSDRNCGSKQFEECFSDALHTSTMHYPITVYQSVCENPCTEYCFGGALDQRDLRLNSQNATVPCGDDGIEPMCIPGQDFPTFCQSSTAQ